MRKETIPIIVNGITIFLEPTLLVRTINTCGDHEDCGSHNPLRLKGIAQKFYEDWPDQITFELTSLSVFFYSQNSVKKKKKKIN